MAKGGAHYDFLRTQNEVHYESIDVIDEWEQAALEVDVSSAEVEAWEKRLDIRLWDMVIADKQIGHSFVRGGTQVLTELSRVATHENICRWVIYTLNKFLSRFQSFKPDLIVMSNNPASLNSLAMVRVAEFLKIPYFIPHCSYIRNRMFLAVNNPFMNSTVINQTFFSLTDEDKYQLDSDHQEFYDRLRSLAAKKPPWLDLLITDKKKSQSLGFIRFWLRVVYELGHTVALEVRRGRLKKRANSLRVKLPYSNFLFWLRQQLAYRKRSGGLAVQPEPGETYVIVPLTVNPEASTTILAPDFVDSLAVVEKISVRVPLHFKVYVTEHPAMLGRRPSGFYDQLESIPNVYVRGPLESNDELIAGAASVILVSGTNGLEALAKGVHTVLLGRSFYSEVGIATFMPSLDDLHEILTKRVDEISSEFERGKRIQGVKRLIFALQKNSFSARSDLFWGLVRAPDDLSLEIKEEVANLATAIEASYSDLLANRRIAVTKPLLEGNHIE